MDMDEKVFDRIEKKYLIDTATKRKILTVIKGRMEKDKYFKSEIFNIYFDTENFDLIIKSIENPDFKEKFRARGYGGYNKVFLEIKTKMKSTGYRIGHKRRVLLTHKDFLKFLNRENTATELVSKNSNDRTELQIAKEIDYLLSRLNLKPQILVYYNRESYIGKNNLRITFDEKLKYRDKDLKIAKKASDKLYFKDEKNIIMEVKMQGVMPLWLVDTLSKNKVYPVRFSKIGKIYELTRKEKNV